MGKLIEGLWDCGYCKTRRILGRYTECPNCGHARDASVKFYLGDREATVDASEVSSGPDWLCNSCSKYNSSNLTVCKYCGDTRKGDSKDYYFMQDMDENNIIEVAEYEYDNSEETKTVKQYQADVERVQRQEEESRAEKKGLTDLIFALRNPDTIDKRDLKHLALGFIAILLVIVLLCITIPMFTLHSESATVNSLSWSTSIRVEKIKTFSESAWNLPSGAKLTHTSLEIHHYDKVYDRTETTTEQYQERVAVGTHEEPTGQTQDMGNGYFKPVMRTVTDYQYVTKTRQVSKDIYKDVPVTQTKYYYTLDRWVHSRDITSSGSDREPVYSEYILNSGERESTKTTSYNMVITTKSGESKEIDLSENSWSLINTGDTIEVKVNRAGAVVFEPESLVEAK